MPTSDGWWEPEFKGANRLVSIGQASGSPRRTRRTEEATHFLAPYLRRPVLVTALRRTDVLAFEPGRVSRKHTPTPERCPRPEPHGRKTAMRFLGRECGGAPHPCSHHCEFMGYI